MSSNTPAAPGWFPDQMDSTQLRWWDGRAWTDQTRPANPPVVSPVVTGPNSATPLGGPRPPKKPWYRRWWAITAAVLVVLSVVGSLSPDDETPASSTADSSQSAGAESTESAQTDSEVEAEVEVVR